MSELVRTLETLELVGGALCLDFVNTVNSRVHPEHEYLMDYAALVNWANMVGILFPAQTRQLQKQAAHAGRQANAALKQALKYRELLYRIFLGVTRGAESGKKDMQAFVTAYGEGISQSRLTKHDDHYAVTWKAEEALDALLWPVLHSAGELLLHGDLDHVKECAGCGWLFLDTSKNQSRRWCSMNTCGARDKMRRYHKRKRTK